MKKKQEQSTHANWLRHKSMRRRTVLKKNSGIIRKKNEVQKMKKNKRNFKRSQQLSSYEVDNPSNEKESPLDVMQNVVHELTEPPPPPPNEVRFDPDLVFEQANEIMDRENGGNSILSCSLSRKLNIN